MSKTEINVKELLASQDSINSLEKIIKEIGVFEIANTFSEYLGYRTYFKINMQYEIETRDIHPFLLIMPFLRKEDNKVLASCLVENTKVNERKIIHNIKRISNMDVTSLEEKVIKTFKNEKLEYALSFCKELYLKDKNIFFKCLYKLSLLDDLNNLKFFVVFAMEKWFSIYEYSDRVFYCYIHYLILHKNNYFNNYSSMANDVVNVNINSMLSHIKEKYDVDSFGLDIKLTSILNSNNEMTKYLKIMLEHI